MPTSGSPFRLPILAAVALATLSRLPSVEAKPDLRVTVSNIAARALERPVAGLSIAVARSGTIVESRGFGFADVERRTPVRPQTVFHIDSVSKNITAAVMLRLVEEGRLSLDDDVARYVGEAPTGGRHVTIRQPSTTGLARASARCGDTRPHRQRQRLQRGDRDVSA